MFKNQGVRTFTVIWFGQTISILGTAMTRFALLIWAYQLTGKATTLALLGFFSLITYTLLGPLAGVWADRWNRRYVMIAGDLGAGLITVLFLVLYQSGELLIWHLYLGEALTGVFEAFQRPAYNASMSILVPREHLGRANGMHSLGGDAANILAPALGGLLLAGAGLVSVLLVDVVTFLVAVALLLFVRIPQPEQSVEGAKVQGESAWRQMTFSFRFVRQRPGLLFLLVVMMLINFLAALTYFGVLPAMILARTGEDELALAAVQAALGIGGVLGGIILTVWGGPRRKIHGVLAFCGLSFLLGDMTFALGQSPLLWVIAAFVTAFFVPFVVSANRTIWQSKVPLDVQGRVLGTAFALHSALLPLGFLLAGPLADVVFEPFMIDGGRGLWSVLVGSGPGAGMGLMFMGTSLLGAVVCFGGYLIPVLRNVEEDLPDCDELAAVVEPVGAAVGGN